MDFPDSIPVEKLDIKNAAFDARKQAINEALYFGGEKFERVKDKLLNPRSIEKQGTGGKSMRDARLKSANYCPHCAGFLDFLCACVFQSTPCVLFTGPEDKVAYYNEINEGLPALLHSRLIQMILHGRAFMSMTEREDEDDGEIVPEFCGIDFSSVTDWDRDEDGDLKWIKTHSIDQVRENPWDAPNLEKNTWTFFTEDGIYEYEATRELRDGKPVDWERDALAEMVNDAKVDGLSAVTEIALPTEFCLMDSISALVIGLFNREASLDYALDTSAFSMIVIKSKKALNKIMASELSALVLDPGDDFKWAAPDGIVYDSLQKRSDDLRRNLETRIHSAALNLATRDQSGRASGIAKFRDFGPIAVLLQFYGDVLRGGLEEHVCKMLKAKGDEGVVQYEIMGLDEFDIQALDQKMEIITKFFALPIKPGKTVTNYVMSDIEQCMMSSAPAELREQAQKEAEGRVIPDKSPPPEPGSPQQPPVPLPQDPNAPIPEEYSPGISNVEPPAGM